MPTDPPQVLGVLSLIVWALILVVTVKYVLITMRADNHGEGGSFALLALLRRVAPRSRLLPALSAAALMATALFYGDARVPGLGVYLSRDRPRVPFALMKSLNLFHVLHQHVVIVSIQTALSPRRSAGARLRFQQIALGVGHAILTYGFLDRPDVPAALTGLPADWRCDPADVSYFLGRHNIAAAANPGMTQGRMWLFQTMMRLSGAAAVMYFRLPPARVAEVGNEIAI